MLIDILQLREFIPQTLGILPNLPLFQRNPILMCGTTFSRNVCSSCLTHAKNLSFCVLDEEGRCWRDRSLIFKSATGKT